jgi:hypothetical protein
MGCHSRGAVWGTKRRIETQFTARAVRVGGDHLRRHSSRTTRSSINQWADRNTLVHEIEHALQDQTFTLPALGGDLDETLARKAAYEGDAEMVAIADALSASPNAEHWTTRITKAIRSSTLDEVIARGGRHTSAFATAPPLLRRRVAFPYREGLALLLDVYRAGGFALVDRALQHPPRTTEQVLHPEKFVAGEGAVRIAPPQAPANWSTAILGTMGEMQTATFLAQCIDPAAADNAARGWGGDTYSIVGDADGHIAILWATAWDDETSAARFESALTTRAACLPGLKLDGSVGRDVLVVRAGTRVAYVQGLRDGAERETAARALLTLAVDVPPAQPPLGNVQIPPLVVPEEAFLRHGRFDGSIWTSDPLGMRVEIPSGLSNRYFAKGELWVGDPRTGTSLFFTIMMQSTRPELERWFLKGELSALRARLPPRGSRFTYLGESRLALPRATAQAYTWRAPNERSKTYAFASICGGKATALFILDSAGDGEHARLRDWLKVFELPRDDAPVCVHLKHATD